MLGLTSIAATAIYSLLIFPLSNLQVPQTRRQECVQVSNDLAISTRGTDIVCVLDSTCKDSICPRLAPVSCNSSGSPSARQVLSILCYVSQCQTCHGQAYKHVSGHLSPGYVDALHVMRKPCGLLQAPRCCLPIELSGMSTHWITDCLRKAASAKLCRAFSCCHLGGLGSDKDVISPSATACVLCGQGQDVHINTARLGNWSPDKESADYGNGARTQYRHFS